MSSHPEIALDEDEIYALSRRGFTIHDVALGEGAFGAVYKGKHYDEDIAVKSIHINALTHIYTLVNEMFILQKLSRHPNIVHVIHFFFISSSQLLIFMEFISGGNVQEHLAKTKGGMKEPIVGRLFQQIGSALLYMHDSACAHLDLKPENIMLSNKNAAKAIAKITDFGLSDVFYFEPTGEELLINGVCGTPQYMAPEALKLGVAMIEKKLRVQKLEKYLYSPFPSDVFSLGVVVYEMLHGIFKYPNKLPINFQENFSGVLKFWEKRQMNYKYSEKLSPELIDLLNRMLQLKPSKRLTMEQVMQHRWAKDFAYYAAETKEERRRDKRCFCM